MHVMSYRQGRATIDTSGLQNLSPKHQLQQYEVEEDNVPEFVEKDPKGRVQITSPNDKVRRDAGTSRSIQSNGQP